MFFVSAQIAVGGVNNKRQTLDEPDVFPYNPVCFNAIPNMFKERYDLHLNDNHCNHTKFIITTPIQIWPQFVSYLWIATGSMWRLLHRDSLAKLCVIRLSGEVLDRTL